MKRVLAFSTILLLAFAIAISVHADYSQLATGNWQPSGSTAEVRDHAASVRLQDGRFLIIGGLNNGAASATVEAFENGGYVAKAPMAQPRSDYSAVVLSDGRVLVTGGTGSSGETLASAEIYDPINNSWSSAGSMTEPRTGHTSTLMSNGDVLIAGGTNADQATATLEVFDSTQGTFMPAGNLSSPRKDLAAAALSDGRVLIIGGSDGNSALASTDIYDPSNGTVSSGPSLALARQGHSATALLNGDVLVAGGKNADGDLASAEVFTATDNSFSTSASSLATARSGHAAFLLPQNNGVLIVGGTAADNALASVELFLPTSRTFAATGSMASARAKAQVGAVQEGIAIATGGTDSSSEVYRFATIKTDAGDYAPGTPVLMAGSGWQPGETVTLNLVESPNIDTHPPMTAVADAGGNILYDQWAPDEHDLNVRFYLTATGSKSEAQTTFTDSVSNVTITSVTPTTTITSLPANVTVNFTYITSTTGATTGTADIVGSGVSASKPLAPGISLSDSITINIPAGTANGTYNVKVTVNNSTGTGANNKNDQQNGAVVINVPTDTTPPVITPTITGTLGANGWYTSNVTVTWSVTDPESAITSQTDCGSTTISTDTTGQMLTCSATSAGGTSSNSVTIKRDASAPTATLAVSAGTLGSNGWYTSDVTLHATGTDSVSSPVSCTADQQQTTETAGTTFNATCTNNAGLSTNAASVTIKLDKTGPSATLSVSAGTAGTNAWYTSDVTVHTDGTDSVSGGVTCTADQFQTAETTGTAFNGSCTDNAGLSTAAAPLTVKLDKTAPAASLAVAAGTLGDNGWYTSDVTLHASGTDSISSPVTCTADQHQTAETTGATFNASCTNDAGLSANATPVTIKLDKTGPSANLSVTAGTAGTNDWYTSDVTVGTNGSDDISGGVTCTPDQFQTAETAGTVFTGSCKNAAGLTAAAAPLTVKLDKTAPTASLAVTSGTLGAHGWYTSDVALHASGTDSISSPVSCTADQHQTAETTGVTFSASCTNDAGLSTNAASVTIKLDKTGPSASLSVTAGTAGTNGWYTSDVTVSTTGSDSISGPVTCSADQFQTAETTGAGFSGSCTNDAGLSTDATPLTVKLDKTAPTASLAVTAGTLGDNGWYISDVTLHASGVDSISSPVNCTPDQVLSTETTGQAVNATCTNDAGLQANAAPIMIKLDKTGPIANLTVTAGTAGANGWYTSDVTIHALGSDTISSPVTCSADQFQTAETVGAIFDGSCKNDAGLTTAAAPLTVKLDKSAPNASSAVIAGTTGAHGWYISDVTIQTTGDDSISGIATCSGNEVISTETAGMPVSGSCTNGAGLVGTSAAINIKLDKTGPSANLGVSAGTAGANGWYTSDVTVSTTGSDTISSPVACSADQFQTAETVGAVFNGSCTNDAGLNTNASPLTVKLDKTAPSANLSITSGTLGDNGWYISDVTLHSAGSDSISGPVNCTTDQIVSTETAGQAVTGTCTNNAGLSATTNSITVKLDKTGPTADLSVSAGTPGANGWYTSNVTVSPTGSDSISSPVSCSADQFQIAETTGTVFTGSCKNDAGLTTAAAPLTVKLDKTGPSASLSVTGGTLGNNGWYVSDVTVSTNGADSISGPVVCTANQFQATDSTGTAFNGSCMNNAGLTTNAVSLAIKLDKTKPTLGPSINGDPVLLNGSYTASANATDTTSGISSQSCGVVNTASVGSKSLTCTATDYAGNQNTMSLNYAVTYLVGGTCLGDLNHVVLQPINLNGTSVFKMGSTVPTKFRVCDAMGHSIGTPNVVIGYGLVAAANSPNVAVDEDVYSTTPDTAFRWDPTAQQWIFNQSTKNNGTLNHTGQTYFFTINLNDGSSIFFQYALK